MLQTRSGKRTGYAAVVIATDLVDEKLVAPKDAVLLVDPESLNQLLAPGFDPDEWKKIPTATHGLPASPGAACGQVVFSADYAVEWTGRGKQVILVRRETVPDDIHGMFVSQGILTATGGMTSHAAVVGRQMGKSSTGRNAEVPGSRPSSVIAGVALTYSSQPIDRAIPMTTPASTPAPTTPTIASTAIQKSTRLTRHSRRISATSIIPKTTASMMIAASTGFGRSENSGASTTQRQQHHDAGDHRRHRGPRARTSR